MCVSWRDGEELIPSPFDSLSSKKHGILWRWIVKNEGKVRQKRPNTLLPNKVKILSNHAKCFFIFAGDAKCFLTTQTLDAYYTAN
jgi:hypothetical protein